ncbi:MAG: M36 family metallopeptidase [Cyanobacteriota bacterium]
MNVNLYSGITILNKKHSSSYHSEDINKPITRSAKQGFIPFMSIPSVAFLGNLVVPSLPEGLKATPEVKINLKSSLKHSDANIVKYKVFPQDPLITKPDIYSLNGIVNEGPENNRIKTVDESQPSKPDSKGNFIEDIESAQFDRVNTFALTQKTLDIFQKALGRKLDWAFSNDQIKVFPRAGKMANAYYNRWGEEIKLFHFNHRYKTGETCYTAKMADVITHETGHAILDGMRPSYAGWGAFGGAIHEGFSDSVAMLVALSDDKLLNRFIENTGGDFRKENIIASLAEQFGEAIYGSKKLYLRNAINNLKMSDFKTGKESSEVHNFGRLFGAMFYDILVDMTTENSKNKSLKEALFQTREDLTRLFARAMGDFSPTVNVYFEDVAKAFLKADKIDFDGKYNDLLTKVFINREILDSISIKGWQEELTNLPQLKITDVDLKSQESIERFVSKHKTLLKLLPDNDYKVESAYKNDLCETFLQMKAPREIELPIDKLFDNQPFAITVYDALTLGFDKEGKLFYKFVKNTKRRVISEAIKDAKSTLLKQKNYQDNSISKEPLVYKLSKNSKIIIKAPKFEDPV